MSEWEYQAVQIDNALKVGTGRLFGAVLNFKTREINDILNRYGKDGWELVQVVPTIGAHGTAEKLLCIFKREKP